MALLRKLTEARIACANSFHELSTLDGLAQEWDVDSNETLESAALDIHLHCESGAKEAHTILDILTGFITAGTAPAYLWMEAELRQENALHAAVEIVRVISQLDSTVDHTELGLKEMKRRADMVRTKLEGVKSQLEQLRAEVESQQQVRDITDEIS